MKMLEGGQKDLAMHAQSAQILWGVSYLILLWPIYLLTQEIALAWIREEVPEPIMIGLFAFGAWLWTKPFKKFYVLSCPKCGSADTLHLTSFLSLVLFSHACSACNCQYNSGELREDR